MKFSAPTTKKALQPSGFELGMDVPGGQMPQFDFSGSTKPSFGANKPFSSPKQKNFLARKLRMMQSMK